MKSKLSVSIGMIWRIFTHSTLLAAVIFVYALPENARAAEVKQFVPTGNYGSSTTSVDLEALRTEIQTQVENYQLQSQSRMLTTRELTDLALGLLALGRYQEALLVSRQAQGTTTDNSQKAMLYMLIAQAYGGLTLYSEAGYAVVDGQRLNPTSELLATYRIFYFSRAGDGLQVLAANHHLAQLNSEFQRRPVMDLISGTVIVIVVGIVCVTGYFLSGEVAKLPTDKIEPTGKAVRNILAGIGEAFAGMGKGFTEPIAMTLHKLPAK